MAKGPQGEIIKLRGVRLSFPELHEPTTTSDDPNEKPKYRASFLLDPENPDHKKQIVQCNNEIKRLIKEKWGEKPYKLILECFGKGETQRNKEGEIYGGYEGMYFISSLNDRRPLLMAHGASLSNQEAEQTFYGGCYVHANINFWTQDNKHGQAIRCSLRGVIFARDGEAFGAGMASEDEFADVLGEGDVDLGDDGLDGLDDELGLD